MKKERFPTNMNTKTAKLGDEDKPYLINFLVVEINQAPRHKRLEIYRPPLEDAGHEERYINSSDHKYSS